MKKNLIYIVCFWLFLCEFQSARAQMPDDGFTMRRGELCLVADYKQSSFKEYWEGKRLRENLNLGKFTSKIVHPMIGYGITDNLIAFAGVPYIDNSSDAGTMAGKKGWQDFSVDLKYQLLNKVANTWTYKLFAGGGVSFPLTGYVPDFLPYSIGLGTKNLAGRIIAHLVYSKTWFSTVQSGYVFRSNITVDRQSYYTDTQHNSNEMKIPNIWEGSLRVGYNASRFRADVHFNWSQCTSGSDMRRNDMPYPGNQMNMQFLGVTGLLWVPGLEGLALHGGADRVVSGRNVGKAFTWVAGVQYVFSPFNKNYHAK